MKYTRLTKEQLEDLHLEFANFLATQSIDKKEWDELKTNKPELAEQELDVFSDLIWEGVLTKANFFEHYAKHFIFLFKAEDSDFQSIIIEDKTTAADFLTKEGLQWLSEAIFTEKVSITTGKKDFVNERNLELFELIKQGAIVTDGFLYKQMEELLEMN